MFVYPSRHVTEGCPFTASKRYSALVLTMYTPPVPSIENEFPICSPAGRWVDTGVVDPSGTNPTTPCFVMNHLLPEKSGSADWMLSPVVITDVRSTS